MTSITLLLSFIIMGTYDKIKGIMSLIEKTTTIMGRNGEK